MKKIDVKLDAKLASDGSVVCQLECDGQHAQVTFTGTDVLFDVPEAAQPAAAERGGIESPGSYLADGGVPVDRADG